MTETQSLTLAHQLGNTKAGSRNRSRSYCFTINNPNFHGLTLHQNLEASDQTESWVFQLECGLEEKTPHFQGVIRFKNQTYFNSVKSLLGETAHIEKCKNWKSASKYCCKQLSRIEGPWSKNVKLPKDIKDVIGLEGAKEWQEDIIQYIQTEPNDREIIWFVDSEGGKGKTALAKHLCLRYGAIMVSGKDSDVKYIIASMSEENPEWSPKIVIWNLPRSTDDKAYISYSGIEQVKDGIFASSKYKGRMVIYNPPHVLIFSNVAPDTDRLTSDRWNIKYL